MARILDDSMAEYFDFASISMPDGMDSSTSLGASQTGPDLPETAADDLFPDLTDVTMSRFYCPTHPDQDDCLCEKIIADFALHEPENPNLQPDNYANFSQWIPRYSKPDRSCGYCRAKHLECYFTYQGQSTCSPCNALFRECSFTMHHAKPTVVMDTLHTVNEDHTEEQGALTGMKALKSYDRSAFHTPDDDDRGSSHKTGTRFPRAAVKVLKEWVDAHASSPYPTEQEKEDLQALTGLKPTQVTNWMANTRRRRKTRVRGVSPSIRSPTWTTSTAAIDIPFDKSNIRHNGKTWDIMNPLERWQHSPPENEPASVEHIANAVATTCSDSQESSQPSSIKSRPGFLSSRASSSSLLQQRAPSCTSLETSKESNLSASMLSSGSLGSSLSQQSHNSFGSNRAKDRRRRRRTAANPSRSQKVQEIRPFQCTFCTDRFRTKYDWSRHEKSLHLSLEKWICAPIGPVVTTTSTGLKQCVYCGQQDPTEEHVETHNHASCEEKGIEARTFYRKDHLRQHLRLVHGCKMIDSMETWKSEAAYIQSRCGFCKQEFSRWQDRVDHLTKHFRAGAQMKDWKGCRGLHPAVAAQVTNAMPPYLIGNESMSPMPFSASNEATWGQTRITFEPGNAFGDRLPASKSWEELIGGNTMNAAATTMPDSTTLPATTTLSSHPTMAVDRLEPVFTARDNSYQHTLTPSSGSPDAVTCWEVLTVKLGKYVRQKLARGLVPTDEELQVQGRRIIYEDEDSWNQTAADNREWLELFKKAHGMPSTAVDARVDFDEDLGARIGELNFEGLMFGDGQDGWEASLGLPRLEMQGLEESSTAATGYPLGEMEAARLDSQGLDDFDLPIMSGVVSTSVPKAS